jgi:hypothetical protein
MLSNGQHNHAVVIAKSHQRPHCSHLAYAGLGSILQTAVSSQFDSIPVLLAKGVHVIALVSKGRSALQLACLYCDAGTVQLLLNSGAWLRSLGTACMLNATIAGNATVLKWLLERSADCNCAIAESGYTVLHVAALPCASYDAKRIAASKEYAALVKQYMDGLKQQSAQQLALLQLRTANTCNTTAAATNSSSGSARGSNSGTEKHNVSESAFDLCNLWLEEQACVYSYS